MFLMFDFLCLIFFYLMFLCLGFFVVLVFLVIGCVSVCYYGYVMCGEV